MLVLPYEDHSGTMAPRTTGFETSVALPASVLYNFGHQFDPPFSQLIVFCFFNPNPGGSLSPSSARTTYPQYIDYYDNVYGWSKLANLADFIYPGSLSQAGQASRSYSRPVTVSNPVGFRIRYPWDGFSLSGVPTVSWSGLNVGLYDGCVLPPFSPVDIICTGDVGAWSFVGAPSTGSRGTTLPNGAPLAGRNRVQFIG